MPTTSPVVPGSTRHRRLIARFFEPVKFLEASDFAIRPIQHTVRPLWPRAAFTLKHGPCLLVDFFLSLAYLGLLPPY